MKKPEPTEPIDVVHERKVSFGNQNAADLTLEISDLEDGEKLLAQITPYLLTKTNNQNKKGKFNSINGCVIRRHWADFCRST